MVLTTGGGYVQRSERIYTTGKQRLQQIARLGEVSRKMTIAMLLVVYLALVGLATVRARQSSTKVFYLLAFAVNAAATCWLFLLFRF